jgi:Raf kinase inhibitor-like YbhB/YbcL family protein
MRIFVGFVFTCLSLALLAGCDPQNKLAYASSDTPAVWGITAARSTFGEMQPIPDKYAYPSNVSPPLEWTDYVTPVVEYVVIVQDVDAKDGPTTNWIVYGIPYGTSKLEEGAATSGKITQGRNSKGTIGYTGPDPDDDKVHRYAFQVFALFKPLGLESGADTDAVVAAMKGKVAAKSRFNGTYQHAPAPAAH